MTYFRYTPLGLIVLLVVVIGLLATGVFADNIDPNSNGSKYAWGENAGWINAKPANCAGCGVTVSNTKLTGYMWGENIGWVNLNCSNDASCAGPGGNWGVTNDGAGHLSGYAWSENQGWISFSCKNHDPTPACASVGNYGVTIDPATGIFHGYAWSENQGWISFSCLNDASCGTVQFQVQATVADLSVSKTALPNPAHTGSPLTYTVTVTNHGPSGATGVMLTDTLPGSVTYVSATPSQGSCNQALGVVSCSLGSLANGVSATVTIIVTPTTGGTLVNAASVVANEPDLTASNNSITLNTPSLWKCTKSDSTVVYRGWPTPAGDDDCDGFTTAIENFVGTDPLVACGGTALPDGSSSTWPPDLNNDGRVNLNDVLKYAPVFNTIGPGPPYKKRFDLNADNRINLNDILKLAPFFNQSCANP
jgi:uncharacterized repeat protein (TIGR01451 family)